MTVLLVNPSWEELVSSKAHLYNWSFPPLDLLNLSAILKSKGLQTRVLDLRASPLSPDRLVREFNAAEKIILTTSPLDRWQCPNIDPEKIFKLTALIRDKEKLIVTGVHGTIFPEYILRHTGAALLVRGEPEKTISEIFDNGDIKDVKGISYVEKEKVISHPDQKPVDLNELPIPDYGAVRIEDYRYEFLGDRYAMLQFSRGCPYNCIFCLRQMYGEGYRRKDPESFVRELDYVVNDMGAESVYIYDLAFTAHKPSVYKICELIRRHGLSFRWCCQTRAEMTDPDLLGAMKSAGCELIHFGVESGSERISGKLEKRISLEQIREGVGAVKAAGISTACFFMFGFPGETIGDMNQTIAFAVETDPDYASFHIAIPYAGTKFYEMTGQEERYPEMYDGEVPAEILKKIMRKAFVRFYLRPGYIAKTLMMRPKELFAKVRLFLSFIR